MNKKIERMTKHEIMEEFRDGEVIMKMSRRGKKMIPLTIRIPAELLQRIGREAQKRNVSGHTTMARILIEEAMHDSRDFINELARRTADLVIHKVERDRRSIKLAANG